MEGLPVGKVKKNKMFYKMNELEGKRKAVRKSLYTSRCQQIAEHNKAEQINNEGGGVVRKRVRGS